MMIFFVRVTRTCLRSRTWQVFFQAAAVAVAPAAADDVMDEGMSQDEKHKRDKNNELHSKALKF